MPDELSNPIPGGIQSSKPLREPILTSKNLSVVVTGALGAIALLKADTKDIPVIIKTLAESKETHITGWVIAGIFLVSSIVLVRLMKYLYEAEIDRLARERDRLQRILLERKDK